MANIVELEINNKNRWVYFTKYRWVAHVGYWIWVLLVGTLMVVTVPITPKVILHHFILDNLIIASFFYIYCLFLIPYFFKRNKNATFWLLVVSCILVFCAIDLAFSENFVRMSNHSFPKGYTLKDKYFDNLYGYVLNFLIFSVILFFMEKNEETHTQLELDKEKMEIEQVKLDLLKTNISPDFLMRSLGQLKKSASNHEESTSESILTFSDLLRYRLYSNKKEETRLTDELNALQSFVHFISLNQTENNLQVVLNVQGESTNKCLAPLALVNILEPFCKAVSNQPVSLQMILLIDDAELTLEMDYSLRANEILLADLESYGNNYKQLNDESIKFRFENCEDERCLISLTLPLFTC
ncbi:histidine kinase [Pedobacter metabolipauper]|uniref:Histidine kinase n=1 Tax=Pedobacter metabolipauper TaxID=425513 RepID=A0A4R6T029_9SPHI|nr:histidine kinase [Pedobacter metabolipauper]TDQ11695.1 histidine kinase [Pedobacter metabolipauper]